MLKKKWIDVVKLLDLMVLHKIFYKNLFFGIDSSNIKLYKIFK